MFKIFGIAVLAVALSACGAPRPRPPAPPSPVRPGVLPTLPAAGHYRIDAARSELLLLVYRAGPMARFGHNHVIVNRALQGSMTLAATATASAFSLTVPTAGFVVDDARLRLEEGPDFADDVPDDAKSGTLRNMLSAAVLDAAAFPSITIDSVAVSAAQGQLTATVAIKLAGHESRIDVPFVLKSDARELSATGSLELRQSAVGLTPYSLMLGALQVRDAMRLKFKIVAIPG